MAKAEFVRVSVCTAQDSLEVRFQEHGLTPGQSVAVYGFANVAAHWGCGSGGGQHTSVTHKATIMAQVSASGEFAGGENGQLSGLLRLLPPRPTHDEILLAAGQDIALQRIVYTDVQVLDDANHVVANVPGVFDLPTIAAGDAGHADSRPADGAQDVKRRGSVTERVRVSLPVNLAVQQTLSPADH